MATKRKISLAPVVKQLNRIKKEMKLAKAGPAKKPARKASKEATLRAPAKKRLTKAQKLKREIARRNRAFENATPSERRVLIAKDVIAQLKASRLIAQRGIWTAMSARGLDIDGAASFQSTFLNNKNVACSCCAVGSLFIGCTLFANKICNDAIQDNPELGNMLFCGDQFANGFDKLFSRKQLGLIELAFEGATVFLDGDVFREIKPVAVTEKEIDAALSFFKQHFNNQDESCPLDNSRARLIKIMENIVANKGTFKP